MLDSEIKIFYSWQSDLPATETRNIIQDAIKEVVKVFKGTLEIEADRDTKGEYGTPDITQTIFSKIDNCDLFIADVSAVCKYETIDKDGKKKVKYMPNPNVMLELGYATHVLGWDNVLCILNSFYGSPDDMPFDLASRRLTPFSLKDGTSKSEAKKYIKGIIQDTVKHLLETGKRVKAGFSNIIVGGFENGKITNTISPTNITNSDSFISYRMNEIKKAQELLDEIASINISSHCSTLVEEDSTSTSNEKILSFAMHKPYKVMYSGDKKSSLEEYCRKYLNKSLSDIPDFWNIGNLKAKTYYGLNSGIEYDGTENEKDKHYKIEELYSILFNLSLLEEYVKSFDGITLFRFALENLSTTYDEDITIHIEIDASKASIVSPSKELIVSSLKGISGEIVDEDFIKRLFFMDETAEICYDDAYLRSIDVTEYTHYMFDASGINGNPKFNAEDYEIELSKYIAAPFNTTSYEFVVSSLKAKERKWLGRVLLIKPKSDEFEIKYSIKSKFSDGSLSGKIIVSL